MFDRPTKLGNNDRIAGQNLPNNNIKIFLIIFDQPFIAQLILPNMNKTAKIIQLLGNKFPTRFNNTVGKYMPNSCVK